MSHLSLSAELSRLRRAVNPHRSVTFGAHTACAGESSTPTPSARMGSSAPRGIVVRSARSGPTMLLFVGTMPAEFGTRNLRRRLNPRSRKEHAAVVTTFRPYADHDRSASVLDYRRLGKQRVEAIQIAGAALSYLTGESGGWTNHPVVRMWAGQPNPYLDHNCGRIHLSDLLHYYEAVSREWKRRGFNHAMDYRALPLYTVSFTHRPLLADHPLPWGPREELIQKHILLRKDPEWYGRFWRIRLRSLSTPGSEGTRDQEGLDTQ